MPLEFPRSAGAAAILALSELLAAPADAAVTGYTDSAAFLAATGPLTTDDFEAVPPWSTPLTEPVTSISGSWSTSESLAFNPNSVRSGANAITDLDAGEPHQLDTISVDLPADVIAVGGWVMTFGDPPFSQADDIVLTAYDEADQIMGLVTLPTAPVGDHRFVGLASDEPISRVEFQSTGVGGDPSPDDFVLDDFSVEIYAGPLPAPLLAPWQLALFGAGLVLLARRFG